MLRGMAALAVLLVGLLVGAGAEHLKLDIIVPEYDVHGKDAYVCTTVPLPQRAYKLVGVQPLAEQSVVHHILLFGCAQPHVAPEGDKPAVWDCSMAPTCANSGAETIIYGWGRNAQDLELPPGVGFSVGGSTSIKFIVAQVHYLEQRPPGDKSGVKLTLQPEPVPFSAGMISYASWFTIPPGKQHHLVGNQCCYRGHQPLVAFAVRVHTHTMGRSVTMTRTNSSGEGYEVLVQGDPQLPQGFYPINEQIVIWPGDKLQVTCDFDSSSMVAEVMAGPTHEHEMCNLYLMTYSLIPHMEMCADGNMLVSESSPGVLPRTGLFFPDPYPLWKPPKPEDTVVGQGEALFGDVASVAVAPDGTLWVLHRGSAVWDGQTFDASFRMRNPVPIAGPVVHQYDPDTGTVMQSWGEGTFLMPHMITVDQEGNLWVTDVGRHQALKFSPEGQQLLAVGTEGEPGGDHDHLCQPTQVRTFKDGTFLVADGYCNSRVMRYNADGSYNHVYFAGDENPMQVVHSILIDECDSLLYVADREGRRVLIFQLHGDKALLDSIDLSALGRVWALHHGPYGRHVALAWEHGQEARLVDLTTRGAHSWVLPGLKESFPHDISLSAAPLAITGAGERLHAIYTAPLVPGGGPLQRLILFVPNYVNPGREGEVTQGEVDQAAEKELEQAAEESGGAATVDPETEAAAEEHAHHHHGGGGGEEAAADEQPALLVAPEELNKTGCSCAGQPNCTCAEDVQADLLANLTSVEDELKSAAANGSLAAEPTESFETLYATTPASGRSFWAGAAQLLLVAAVLAVFVGALAFWGITKYTSRPEGRGYSGVDSNGDGGGGGGGRPRGVLAEDEDGDGDDGFNGVLQFLPDSRNGGGAQPRPLLSEHTRSPV